MREIKLKPKHIAGFVLGFIIIIIDIFFFITKGDNRLFRPVLVIGLAVMSLMFFFDFLNENKRQKEIEFKFLEFVRALVETVRGGVPVPRAIMQISNEDYGALNPYIRKLSNQIEWGYPLHDALVIFSRDTNNPVINRSVAIVIQAERSGGDMGTVLQEITKSVVEIKKIKEERKSNAYTQVVQGYIIFFIFIIIMLVLQKFLLPRLEAISSDVLGSVSGSVPGIGGLSGGGGFDFGPIFIGLILIQGLFAGLMIGKFSEGSIKNGVKHSAIMMILGYIIITTVMGVKEDVVSILFLLPITRFKNKYLILDTKKNG